MKKYLWLLVVCLFISGYSYAQNDTSYGIKGGLNYSNLVYEFEDSNNGFFDFNSKIGFT